MSVLEANIYGEVSLGDVLGDDSATCELYQKVHLAKPGQPKVPKTLTFTLTEESLRNVRWTLLVLFPLVPALLGAVIWWQRRA